MSYKYIITVAVIAFMSSRIHALHTKLEPDNPSKILIDKVISDIKTIVDRDVTDMRMVFEEKLKSIEQASSSFLKTAQTIINPLNNEILDISNDAIFAGANITECEVDSVVAKLLEMPKTYQGQLDVLIRGIEETFNITLEGQIKKMDAILAEAQNMDTEASNCGSPADDSDCWIQLAEKAARYMTTIPPRLKLVYSSTITQFTSEEQLAWRCKLETTSNLSGDIYGVLKNVVECIDRKMIQ